MTLIPTGRGHPARSVSAAVLGAVLALGAAVARADDAPAADDAPVADPAQPRDEGVQLPGMTIVGSEEERARQPGSAYVLDEEELEVFEYDDVGRTLYRRPGVYIREEDGWGLRPNIGIRGVSSERSQKVVLLEDRVLLAPAPYSAAAAYYFPLTTRAVQVDVFKGPAAIRYGPNTIGGAVNVVTRPIPDDGFAGGLDLAYGSYQYRKAHGYGGYQGDHLGFLIEGVYMGSDGFKHIDGPEEGTGFDKGEAVLKARIRSDRSGATYQHLEARVGYSIEASDETYLGLTDRDFRDDPYRRYVASERDEMDWDRVEARLDYHLDVEDVLSLDVVAYRHDFYRVWDKLNRFRRGPAIADILANPDGGQEAVFLAVLRGEEDSAGANQALMMGRNARRFISQGIQADATLFFETGPLAHELDLGARFHHDQIIRHHSETAFVMQDGRLRGEGTPREETTRNRGSARALAAYIVDDIRLGDLTVSPGARIEWIETELDDDLAGTDVDASDVVFLPGIGAFFELFPGLGLLGGVHRGFSPLAPGQDDNADPELSWNYEGGVRYWDDALQVEVIGFFNDYSNLTGTNTFAGGSSEQDLDEQFDGGAVWVYGVEVAGSYVWRLDGGIELSAALGYTLSISELRETFTSANPQFGSVEAGDSLPYLPVHQATATLGVRGESFAVHLSGLYVGEQFEEAYDGNEDDDLEVDDRFVLDLRAQYTFFEHHTAYVAIDNLLDDDYLAARRPFGARPGKPFQVIGGYKLTF